ncbi:MAG: hypothetical protein ACXU7D_01660 [Burkholderiaceae bacterium]
MDKAGTRIEKSKIRIPVMSMTDMSSSQGDASLSVTPKDVSPDYAAAKDVAERKIHSDDLDERQEAWLDEAIDLTFPASDPISVPSYGRAKEKTKAVPVQQENDMTIVVPNTRPDMPRVTLFGQLDDGGFTAEVMDEDAVPYTHYWENAIDQAMVYIEPDDHQLEQMVRALNEGKLEFSGLQDFGASDGGTSIIVIEQFTAV